MTNASRSSQARSMRLTSKSARWVSRCPRNRVSRSQFRGRTSNDRGRPGRFGASLGSLTTTRPIVRPNCLPVRTRFIPAGNTNPIFCCPCCPCDRQSRLRVRVSNPTLFSSRPHPTPFYNAGEVLNVGFDVQDLFVQVTVVIHLKSTLPRQTTTGGDDRLLCCGGGQRLAGTLAPLQDSEPSRRNTSFALIKWEFLLPLFRSKIDLHRAVTTRPEAPKPVVTAG